MDNEPDEIETSKGQFLIYEAEDGRLKLDVRLEDETVWLTQPLWRNYSKQPSRI